jgi:uncharacterized protein (TIGR02246 family)
VRADSATKGALLELLDHFCSAFAARDAETIVGLFAPDDDVVMVTSEDALLRGPAEIAAFARQYASGTITYSWEWDRREVSAAGTVGWLLAQDAEMAAEDEHEERHPYRMSLVCEQRDGLWFLAQVHGSTPYA